MVIGGSVKPCMSFSCYYLMGASSHSIAFEGKLFVYKMEVNCGDAARMPVYHSSLECQLNHQHALNCGSRSVLDHRFKVIFY